MAACQAQSRVGQTSRYVPCGALAARFQDLDLPWLRLELIVFSGRRPCRASGSLDRICPLRPARAGQPRRRYVVSSLCRSTAGFLTLTTASLPPTTAPAIGQGEPASQPRISAVTGGLCDSRWVAYVRKRCAFLTAVRASRARKPMAAAVTSTTKTSVFSGSRSGNGQPPRLVQPIVRCSVTGNRQRSGCGRWKAGWWMRVSAWSAEPGRSASRCR